MNRVEAGVQAAPGTDLEPGLGWYLYGIVPVDEDGAADLPEGLAGIDDSGIEVVAHGPVGAAVGAIALERPPGRRADLVAHKTVLDALAEAGPVVPVQFGSVMPSRGAIVEDVLAPDAEHFAALLADLAGKVQFQVRATYHEGIALAEIVEGDPEIAELRRRTRELPEDAAYGERVRLGELVARAMEAKREQESWIVLDAVLPHVAAHQVRPGASVDHLVEVAVLVDEADRVAFEDALEGVAEALHERIRLQLLGPMAPYDFVEG